MDPARLTRPATPCSVDLGGVQVSYVPDGAVKIRPNYLFPGVSEIDPAYLDGNGCLIISSGGLLIQRDGRTVLIDAGYGPHPEPVTMEEYGIAPCTGGVDGQSSRAGRVAGHR